MNATQATKRVFVSHSERDKDLARDVARRLRSAGLEPVQADAVLSGGAPWRRTLRDTIRKADAVLFLMTPSALASDWLVTELGMAEGAEKKVVPVTVSLEPGQLPPQFQSYHAMSFDKLDQAIQHLVRELATQE